MPLPVPPIIPQGPFPTPTPLPQATSNLAPHSTGLSIAGADQNGNFEADNIKVSWWVRNTGPFTISETFSIDVRFDGKVLRTWTVDGLALNAFVFVEDVENLLAGLRPSAGVHEISIVMDPLDQVVEIIESDNSLTFPITMLAPSPDSETPVELRPNLVIAPDTGKSQPLFVSSHPEDPLSGKLSVASPTYVAAVVRNQSIQYITSNVEVDLYLDDLLVERARWSSIGAGGRLNFRIDDLRSITSISPGPHTLRIVADPLNRIQEFDETDNEFEIDLVWGVDQPEAAAEPFVLLPPEREPTTLPNLVPIRRFGWDAALTARLTDSEQAIGTDGRLEAARSVSIDFTFTNRSRTDVSSVALINAAVLVDGVQVDVGRFSAGATNVGSVWADTIILPADSVTPGEHIIRVVLDPEERIDEFSEEDNIFERAFTFHGEPDSTTPEPFQMSEQELADAFAPLFGEMRRQMKPALILGSGEHDWTPEIMAAGRAGYYLLTGRDLDEEGFVMHFLPAEAFDERSIGSCMSGWITMTEEEYQQEFESCLVDRNEIGFKTRFNGQIHIFVDLGLSPMDALGTYFHELGHGLQDLTNPEQTELRSSTNARGLYEAQAQIFEAAAWRAIEEHTGKSFSSSPDIEDARDSLEFRLNLRETRNTEHDVGYRLLWAQALIGIAGPYDLPAQLRASGVLDAEETYALFDYLVSIEPSDVDAWANALLSRTDLFAEFKSIAETRLVANLPLDLISHPAGQDTAWLAP
jgi:hypothetical protein